MGKEYEVSMVVKSAEEAFGALRTLPQPICAIVYSDGGDIKSSTYKEIVGEVKRAVPVMFEISISQFAEEKFEKGRNIILKFTPQTGSSSGDLHQIITNLHQRNRSGSVVGICVKSRAAAPISYSTDSARNPDGVLDYTITIK